VTASTRYEAVLPTPRPVLPSYKSRLPTLITASLQIDYTGRHMLVAYESVHAMKRRKKGKNYTSAVKDMVLS
jgi:hypothetical protein